MVIEYSIFSQLAKIKKPTPIKRSVCGAVGAYQRGAVGSVVGTKLPADILL